MPELLKVSVGHELVMRCAWLWLGLSLAGLCLGLGLVLTFNHMLVVPHQKRSNVVHTDCYITAIHLVPLERANCTMIGSGQTQTKCGGQNQVSGSIPDMCAQVRVLYYAVEGHMTSGVLHPDYEDLSMYPNDTAKCRCVHCHPEAGVYEGLTPETYPTPEAPETARQKSVTEVTISGRHLRIGSKTRCYYRTKGATDVFVYDNKSAMIIHAVLWPTIIFIAGFVGLFFSCIGLQTSALSLHNQRRPSSV